MIIPETNTDQAFPENAIKHYSKDGGLLRVTDGGNGRILWSQPPPRVVGKKVSQTVPPCKKPQTTDETLKSWLINRVGLVEHYAEAVMALDLVVMHHFGAVEKALNGLEHISQQLIAFKHTIQEERQVMTEVNGKLAEAKALLKQVESIVHKLPEE